MELPRYQRRMTAVVLASLVLVGLSGLTACTEEGRPEGLPSARPSADSTEERTGRPTPTETEAEEPEPTRTQQTRTEPTRTEATRTEPTRTEPTRTEPTRTEPTPAEPTRTEDPTREPTQEPTRAPEPTTAATTSTSAAAVPVAGEDDDGSGVWGWILLLLLFTGLAGVLLVGRSRRDTTWDVETRGLAGETRMVIEVRLPPILTTADPVRRGLVWPPVRDQLSSLAARWAAQLEATQDGGRQAYASQVTEMLGDLVSAVDAENEAMAAGRDWRMVRPRPEAVIEALNAALAPDPVPATVDPATQAAPPFPANQTAGEYDKPPGSHHVPRHEAPEDGPYPGPEGPGDYRPTAPGS